MFWHNCHFALCRPFRNYTQTDFFSSRRSSIHGTPTHGAGGMGASTSILQTSHVLEQTDSHLIEAYGATLPVVVTEILTISESKHN